ncbi:hypothetical protein BTVI_24662 [Pitangus sulphuratus]|nr:hypothetical protein BTVI_24662 [Pitangus sulphuratus]
MWFAFGSGAAKAGLAQEDASALCSPAMQEPAETSPHWHHFPAEDGSANDLKRSDSSLSNLALELGTTMVISQMRKTEMKPFIRLHLNKSLACKDNP